MCNKNGTTDCEILQKPKGPLVAFTTEVCIMVGIANGHETKTRKLAEFIPTQSADAGCPLTLASAGKLTTRFNVDGNRVFF